MPDPSKRYDSNYSSSPYYPPQNSKAATSTNPTPASTVPAYLENPNSYSSPSQAPANQTKETSASGDYSNYAPQGYPPQSTEYRYGNPNGRAAPPANKSGPNAPYGSHSYPNYEYNSYQKPGASRNYPPQNEYNQYSRFDNRGYPSNYPPQVPPSNAYPSYPPRDNTRPPEHFQEPHRSRFNDGPRPSKFDDVGSA